MLKMLKGVRVPHRKNTYLSVPKEMPPPKSVTLLCSMHIGKPAVPVVKIGDSVRVGQLIAEQNGFISSPVHASISGTVKKIDNVLISSGAYVPAVTIESDGLMEKTRKRHSARHKHKRGLYRRRQSERHCRSRRCGLSDLR